LKVVVRDQQAVETGAAFALASALDSGDESVRFSQDMAEAVAHAVEGQPSFAGIEAAARECSSYPRLAQEPEHSRVGDG
jgi:hypothetical protein